MKARRKLSTETSLASRVWVESKAGLGLLALEH